MKILHILDHSVPSLSGYSVRSKSILDSQKKLGLEVAVVTSPKHSGPASGFEEIDGTRYYRSGAQARPYRRLMNSLPVVGERVLMSTLYDRIAEVLNQEPVDLIHAHSPVLCGYPALKAAKKFGIPVVYEIRYFWEDAAVEVRGWGNPRFSIRYQATRYLETQLAKKADAVVTICEGLKSDLAIRGVSTAKIHIVPNGVDPERFQPSSRDMAYVRKYALEDTTVIGFVGSFYEYEGIEYIIRALPTILQSHPQARVLLIGGGEEPGAQRERARLEALTGQLGVQNQVIFTGRVPHSEILSYYSVMDIVVYPRIKSRLTELVTPLKPLEPMAMGKAVIASDIGGLRELIADGETGLLFEPENPESLAQKCLDFIHGEKLRKEIGHQARLDMIHQRDWSQLAGKYGHIYRSYLA